MAERYVETIEELFGLVVLDQADELRELAKGSSESRSDLLDAIDKVEEMERCAEEIRLRLEHARDTAPAASPPASSSLDAATGESRR